jgi:hypothetical protein
MLRFMLVCACALIVSCRDATDPPGQPDEEYVLRSVAGAALPATVVVGDATEWQIVADTMRFRSDGTGTEVFVWRTTVAGQAPGDPEREERSFQYQLKPNGVVEIEFPCPDFPAGNTASCIAPPHYRGTIGDAEIEFDFALSYPTPFRFERVAGSE